MYKEQFIKILSQLRKSKNISARDMSLSLGQSQNYINNIEKGNALPSMSVFFYICDYLSIAPKDFFKSDFHKAYKTDEMLAAIRNLDTEQLNHLIAIANDLKRY